MLVQLLSIAILVLSHIFAGRLRHLSHIPRSVWLSLGGGISVSYVFLHIFPELNEAQQHLAEQAALAFIESHAYLVALVGLLLFYVLEHKIKASARRSVEDEENASQVKSGSESGTALFWLHIGSFSLYNFLIGYLLVYRDSTVLETAFFVVAMACHFLVNDHSLYYHHRSVYLRFGRWILSTCIGLGWIAGLMFQVSEAATSVLFAFLAGGIILNVLKEELPEERKSRVWPFGLGAMLYSVLLLTS
jgi:zinc transporter ZupT